MEACTHGEVEFVMASRLLEQREFLPEKFEGGGDVARKLGLQINIFTTRLFVNVMFSTKRVEQLHLGSLWF